MAKAFKLVAAMLLAVACFGQNMQITGRMSLTGKFSLASGASAPVVNLSANSLTFGNVVENVTSAPLAVTLTNIGSASLTISIIITTGDFANTTTCGGSLAATHSCQINATFTPLSTGALTGAVTITDNAAGSPHVISLTGTGTDPAMADCGLSSYTGKCGNVGPVTPLPSPTSISACNPSLSAGVYLLTQSVSAGLTGLCFGASYVGVIKLDLGGFTVTGGIDIRNGNLNGFIVQNGIVNCNRPLGCVYMQGDGGTPSVLAHVNHLTTNQSALNSYGVFVTWTAISSGTLEPGVEIDHMDGACIPGGQPSSSRNNCLYFTGPYVAVEYDHNLLNLPATAAACQGLVAYEAPGSQVINNFIQLADPEVISGDSCRGILFDSEGKYGYPGTGGGSTAAYNYIVTGPNRAVRVRAEQGDMIHDNTVTNIRLGGTLAAIHIGDTDLASELTQATVYNNSLEIRDGNAIVLAGSNNETATAYSNTVTCYGSDCSAAGFFFTTQATSASIGNVGPVATNVKNNTVTPLTSASKTAVYICGTGGGGTCSLVAANSTGTVCNTGIIGGGGTITTNSTPCP